MKVLDLQDYAGDINLFERYLPTSKRLSESGKRRVVDALLEATKPAVNRIGRFQADTYSAKRRLLHAAINTLDPGFFNDSSIAKLDRLLQTELHERVVVDTADLARSAKLEIEGTKIILWQGDISTLKIDAVVNAANNRLLGCFQPLHSCIDNVIHSRAGVRLRDDCHIIMQKQNMPEPTGFAKLTRAYNLPSAFVIHTVGPVVRGKLKQRHKEALHKSYTSCLNVATSVESIKSVAVCCISTGMFGYPSDPAAQTAFDTVCRWLKENPGRLESLVFDVFTDRDRSAYMSLIDKS